MKLGRKGRVHDARSYVVHHLVQDGQSGSLAEVDLMGHSSLLKHGESELVVLPVDVKRHYLHLIDYTTTFIFLAF